MEKESKKESKKQKKKRCCIPHCYHDGRYVVVPKEEKLRKLWFHAFRMEPVPHVQSPRVCRMHFKDEDFEYSNTQLSRKKRDPEKRRLKDGAIPSQNLRTDLYRKFYKSKLYNSAAQRAQRVQKREAKKPGADTAVELMKPISDPNEIVLRSPNDSEEEDEALEVEDLGDGDKCVQANLSRDSLKTTELLEKLMNENKKLKDTNAILRKDKSSMRDNIQKLEINVASLSNQNSILQEKADVFAEKAKMLEDKVNILEANRLKNAQVVLPKTYFSKGQNSPSKTQMPREDSESFSTWTLSGAEEGVQISSTVLESLKESGITALDSEHMHLF